MSIESLEQQDAGKRHRFHVVCLSTFEFQFLLPVKWGYDNYFVKSVAKVRDLESACHY